MRAATRRGRSGAIALAIALSLARTDASGPAVVQPRPFGHVIGEVVTQRIRLDAGFAPAAVVVPARVGAWFERRALRLEAEADGTRWLAVDYQLVNVPTHAATLRLPAWQLPSANGAPALPVAAATLAVAPLLEGDADAAPRPDRDAPGIALAPLRRSLAQAVAATLAIVLAWSAWWAWRQWRARRSQPFARALHALRDEVDEATAWRRLHAAFDSTAGEVLRPATLDRLFERAPHLRPEHAIIERFYAESAMRFFGGTAASAPVSPLAVCRALRRLERAHER